MAARFDWGRITGILSMVVALCALGASLWQGYLLQRHNKLSVTPALEAEFNVAETHFEIMINNNGLGPAKATEAKAFLDGKVLDDWTRLRESLGLTEDCFGYGHVTRVYGVGDRQLLFGSVNRERCNVVPLDEALGLLERIAVIINYESLYGDDFTLTFGNGAVP